MEIALTFDVRHGDFVLEYATALAAMSKVNGRNGSLDSTKTEYNLVISNPPYFKISKDDPEPLRGTQ